jgi:signal transduction histidine kinase
VLFRSDQSINGTDISVDTIEELIKLHHGQIIYDNKFQKGSSTTIKIPYSSKKRIRKPDLKNRAISDNIIYLPIKNKSLNE